MKIDGKSFIVTGGASGLGEGAVRLLVEKGANVTIFDFNKDRGEALAKELGAAAAFVECNVMEEESIINAIQFAKDTWGRIDGSICCAGGGAKGTGATVNRKGEAHAITPFELTVKLNLIGTFSICSKAAAIMAQNEPEDDDGERGVMINVASVAYQDGQNGQAAYSAAKGGIAAMTLPMARDLAKRGIRVNTIAPGLFHTPMTAPMDGSRVETSLKSSQLFPADRFGVPDEFAHLACSIIENKMLNGDTIRLDGGIRMPRL